MDFIYFEFEVEEEEEGEKTGGNFSRPPVSRAALRLIGSGGNIGFIIVLRKIPVFLRSSTCAHGACNGESYQIIFSYWPGNFCPILWRHVAVTACRAGPIVTDVTASRIFTAKQEEPTKKMCSELH